MHTLSVRHAACVARNLCKAYTRSLSSTHTLKHQRMYTKLSPTFPEIKSTETKRASAGRQQRDRPSVRRAAIFVSAACSSVSWSVCAMCKRSCVARSRIEVLCMSATLNGAAAHCAGGRHSHSPRYTSTFGNESAICEIT